MFIISLLLGRITTSELPAHIHTGTTNSSGNHSHSVTMARTSKSGNGTQTVWSYYENLYGNGSVNTSNSGNHNHSFTTNVTGGDSSHNIMQPYQVVYRWRRTA
ncbi:hypothetical protein [uncultured Dialister sp.]|uniref:phage baseplate protein n=1 Tax=uncultured Dialister sp. TaxID=278064 RepID=UPI0035A8D9CB